MCFEKKDVGYLRNGEMLELFKPLPLYLAPLKTLLVVISGAVRMQRKPISMLKI